MRHRLLGGANSGRTRGNRAPQIADASARNCSSKLGLASFNHVAAKITEGVLAVELLDETRTGSAHNVCSPFSFLKFVAVFLLPLMKHDDVLIMHFVSATRNGSLYEDCGITR